MSRLIIPGGIQVKMNRPFSGHATLENDLGGVWKFDEISGTTAEDAHGSNDGTASNARIFTTEAAGKRNTCADFTQGDDYITIPHNSSISGDTMSYGFWLKMSGSVGAMHNLIIKAANTGFNREIGVLINTDGKLYVSAYTTNPNTATNVITPSSIWSTSWKHYLIVKDLNGGNTRITIFQNASQIKQETLSYKANTNSDNYTIGAVKTSGTPPYLYFANGFIDEMYFWKAALTADDAEDIYADGAGRFY